MSDDDLTDRDRLAIAIVQMRNVAWSREVTPAARKLLLGTAARIDNFDDAAESAAADEARLRGDPIEYRPLERRALMWGEDLSSAGSRRSG